MAVCGGSHTMLVNGPLWEGLVYRRSPKQQVSPWASKVPYFLSADFNASIFRHSYTHYHLERRLAPVYLLA